MAPTTTIATRTRVSVLASACFVIVGLSACVGEIDGVPLGEIDSGNSGYHPTGYAASTVHGLEFNVQQQNCKSCHGDDLNGATVTGVGEAVSCDTCHTPADPPAWRTDCTFCHGGTDSTTGAPPGQLDGAGDTAFGAHSAHLGSQMMANMDCTDCHTKPTDVFTTDHAFDTTAGAAEVIFAAGRSPDGTYASAQCDNLYCHGNGQANDTVLSTAGAMTCGGCHGLPPNSGEHGDHSGENCFECHNDTTKDDTTIADLALHIDGNRQVVIDNPGGLTVVANGNQLVCSGQCHGVGRDHQNDTW